MLSGMETNATRLVDDVQRHQLAVYRSQVTPGWAWPAFGVAVFLFVSSYQLQDAWVHIAAVIAYAIFVGIWVGLIRTRSGVQPRLRGMPRPLFGEVVRAWVAGLVLMGAAVAIGLVVSFVLGGALAGIVTTAGGRYYDRRYRRRADALAAGLSTLAQ